MTTAATLRTTVQSYAEALSRVAAQEAQSNDLAAVERLQIEVEAAAHDVGVVLESAARGVAERVQVLRAARVELTVGSVVEMLRTGQCSLADLAQRAGLAVHVPAMPCPVAAPAPAASSAAAVASEAPKRTHRIVNHAKRYQDPASGRVWQGLGPCPKWLKALFVGGKTLADFEMVEGGAVAPAAEPASMEQPAASAPVAPAVAVEAPASEARPEDSDIGVVGSFDATDFKVDDIDNSVTPTRASGDDGFHEMLSGLDAAANGSTGGIIAFCAA